MPNDSAVAIAAGDAGATATSSAPVELPQALKDYDAMIQESLTPYLALSKEIGGLVAEQSLGVEKLFAAQRDFIYILTQSKKPDPNVFVTLLKPTSGAMETVSMIRENNRSSEFFNHLSTVSEGVPALGWVAVDPTPVPHIAETKESARFYANRVLKEWKDKDRMHVDWINAYLGVLNALQVYVKDHYTTGLIWNANGQDASSVQPLSKASGAAAPAAAAGGPPPPPPGPPPPPPPPPADFADKALSAAAGAAPAAAAGGAMSGVFAELNQGQAVTSHLKKVDPSQQTHKNPDLRASSVVSTDSIKSKSSPPTRPSKPSKFQVKKPKLALDGNKWTVENYENDNNIVIDQTGINQTVYIFGLKASTVQIKGKVNAITLDSCTKTGILLDSVVSSVDLVNCKSCQVQVTGTAPTCAIDKTDGAQLYLSKRCFPPMGDIEIFTAKSSAVNVSIQTGEEGEFDERPVPEQFKTMVSKDGKLMTTVVEHAG